MSTNNTQAEVVMYTTPWCPYCIRAKHLLNKKGVSFKDHNVANDAAMRAKLVEWTRRRTVPQIFINGKSIGGCDELYALDSAGALDTMLAEAPAAT